MINCLLAGVGGQGIVLASRLIASCAIDKGLKVLTAETIGMAQRGGSVVSHVRIGDGIYSPLIPYNGADLLIGFEPAEAVRTLVYLKKEGTVIVSSRPISSTTANLSKNIYDSSKMIDFLKDKVSNLVVVDADSIIKACGTSKVLNLALLGTVVATGKLGFEREDFKKIIDEKTPEKYRELNHKAFDLGFQFKMKEV